MTAERRRSAPRRPIAWTSRSSGPASAARRRRARRASITARASRRAARRARRAVLPAPARAADRARRGRPARDPLARPAGHARRRRRARPRAARGTGPSRDLLARLARLERGEPEPEAEPPAPVAAPERAPLAARALALEERCAPRATSRRSTREPELLAALREHGRAVRLGPTMHVHVDALADVEDRVIAIIRTRARSRSPGCATSSGTSRKYAQALSRALRRRKLDRCGAGTRGCCGAGRANGEHTVGRASSALAAGEPLDTACARALGRSAVDRAACRRGASGSDRTKRSHELIDSRGERAATRHRARER